MSRDLRNKDLVILAADKQAEFALRGILKRTISIGVRDIDFDILVHPERDPGCYLHAANYLRSSISLYNYALVILDFDGSGQEDDEAMAVEARVETVLSKNGWKDRAVCIVIDPELEVWVWSTSQKVQECLGWGSNAGRLREWLKGKGLWGDTHLKPPDPKDTMDVALREIGRPRSAAIFQELAESVSLSNCQDRSFNKLKSRLQTWFPRT